MNICNACEAYQDNGISIGCPDHMPEDLGDDPQYTDQESNIPVEYYPPVPSVYGEM